MRLHRYDIASYPRLGRRAEKPTVVRGTPGFLGAVGAIFPPPSGPGYEANETMCTLHKAISWVTIILLYNLISHRLFSRPFMMLF